MNPRVQNHSQTSRIILGLYAVNHCAQHRHHGLFTTDAGHHTLTTVKALLLADLALAMFHCYYVATHVRLNSSSAWGIESITALVAIPSAIKKQYCVNVRGSCHAVLGRPPFVDGYLLPGPLTCVKSVRSSQPAENKTQRLVAIRIPQSCSAQLPPSNSQSGQTAYAWEYKPVQIPLHSCFHTLHSNRVLFRTGRSSAECQRGKSRIDDEFRPRPC